jgi:uncharacterized SAM-binding protein YcdF (DUF218 family)
MTSFDLGELLATTLAYGALCFVRVSGLAAVVRAIESPGVFFLGAIQSVVQFVFFDGFSLAVIGLFSSLALAATTVLSRSDQQYRRLKLASATGVGVPALVYILGSIVIVLR